MTATVTMSDIATLAGVTRQAVTNWRRRPAGVPFPNPIAGAKGGERFDLDAVVAWLEQTGRGNNAEARTDAPTIALPEGVAIEAAVVALAVRASVAEDLAPLEASERVAAARRLDPHDGFVLTEFEAIAEDNTVVSYVDELLAASFGPADALDRLYRTSAALGDRGMSESFVEMLHAVALSCRDVLGGDGVSVDFRLHPRARSAADGFDIVAPGSSRAALQHLVACGREVGAGDGPVVRLVSVLGMEDADALRLVVNVSLDLAAEQIAVIVGPASALCDRLIGELYRTRRDTISGGARGYGGSLAAAFRLPRGLWAHAHRQHSGLWVLLGASTPDTTVVGDITAQVVDPTELAHDIVAALERTSSRSYKYGRRVAYNTVWTREAVVDLGAKPVRAPSVVEADSRRGRVIEATLVTREPIDGFDLTVGPASELPAAIERPLNALISDRLVTLLRGARIAPEHTSSVGAIRVLSAGPGAQEIRMDWRLAANHYYSAARTEPGDVIFVDHPEPRALVDDEGGAIVQTPSRILRVARHAGIGARALAAVINATANNSEWRTWGIPQLPSAEVDRVEDALAAAARHSAVLHRSQAAITTLVSNLVLGVAEGSITLDPMNFEKKAG